MKEKQKRLEAICEIMQTDVINNQEELLKRLEENGFSVTQATLSRDIRALKIAKVHDKSGNYVYRLPDHASTNTPKQEMISSPDIEFSGNLAIMKTRPGYAMGIASDIDNANTEEILATIAGDDTILIVPREGISKERVVSALLKFME